MIYICSGIGALCRAPCILCREGCKCCDEACKAFNKACGGCCDAIKDCWSPIIDNPLAMFVLGTWAIQGLVLCCAGYAFSGINDECKLPGTLCTGAATDDSNCATLKSDADEATSNAQIYLGVMFLFTIIHNVFAFYLQRKLVWSIQDAEEGTKISKLIMDILKRDIPFCLYFFFAIGAFGYCCWGMNTGAGDNCKYGETTRVQTGTGGVAMVSIIYGILVPYYGCCFVFGKVSSDTVGSVKEKTDAAKQKAAGKPQIFGSAQGSA